MFAIHFKNILKKGFAMFSRYLKLILILVSVNTALHGMISFSDIENARFDLAYKESFNLQDEAHFMELLDYKGINETVAINSFFGPMSFLFGAVKESHS